MLPKGLVLKPRWHDALRGGTPGRDLTGNEDEFARILRPVRTLVEISVKMLDVKSGSHQEMFRLKSKRVPHRERMNEPLTSAGAPQLNPQVRLVELVVNGLVVASKSVPADSQPHELEFSTQINQSSWVAVRHFPQMHTNPVNVSVGELPIRASRQSALWCIAGIEQLWRVRNERIVPQEREEARKTFWNAIDRYRQIAQEAGGGS